MRRIRVIPMLLIQGQKLVKTIRFKKPSYVGDPLNALRIFNEKEVDEVAVLDITGDTPNFDYISKMAGECFMPLAYGGGISNLIQVQSIFTAGVEKVILGNAAFTKISLVSEIAKKFGSQSIVASIDVKRNWFGSRGVYIENASKKVASNAVRSAQILEEAGAGEILLQCVDRDGTFQGYDLELIETISANVSIPVIAAGGAATLEDLHQAVEAGASAVAAGAMFVYRGPHRAVLINYPTQKQLMEKLYRRS
jgi:imidazole glycerol-phosphate synthase subunit HisF